MPSSTEVSGQTISSSSCFVTSVPARRTSATRTSYAFGASVTSWPDFESRRSCTSSAYSPNPYSYERVSADDATPWRAFGTSFTRREYTCTHKEDDMQDPFVGMWKLNPARSQFDPNHRPGAATMRWRIEPDGGYLLLAEGTDERGQP